MTKLLESLMKELGIDETMTRRPRKPKKAFNKVKNSVFPAEDHVLQADILELPTTSQGFKYLLVVVDLWSDEFDIEPLKNKEAKTARQALEKIFNITYLNKTLSSRCRQWW